MSGSGAETVADLQLALEDCKVACISQEECAGVLRTDGDDEDCVLVRNIQEGNCPGGGFTLHEIESKFLLLYLVYCQILKKLYDHLVCNESISNWMMLLDCYVTRQKQNRYRNSSTKIRPHISKLSPSSSSSWAELALISI